MMRYWIYLAIAILFEVAGTTSMKLSAGFTRLLPSICILIFYVISFSFLTLTLKKLDVSVAYAVWCGVGIVLICIIGHYFFSESMGWLKVLFIALIILGVVGLNMITKH